MAKTASKFVEQLAAWVGMNEADGSFKKIIDIYNSHKPLARGYKLPYDKPWCAATVSAAAIACGYTDIIPTEVSCDKMITLAKEKGIWIENENVTPLPAWLVLYDWDDNGGGDNKGYPDHVGGVEKVSGGKIIVIEGNYNNAVGRRTLDVNGQYIRGYIAPKYDPEDAAKPAESAKPTVSAPTATTPAEMCTIELPLLSKGSKGPEVRTLQYMLNGAIGAGLGIDGDFGDKTDAAVRSFQTAYSLTVDGVVFAQTWPQLVKYCAPASGGVVSFKVGDKVMCNPGTAKYSNGNTMPEWVPSSVLYVRAVENDGKILLVSTEPTKKVYTGRVNASDMHKI